MPLQRSPTNSDHLSNFDLASGEHDSGNVNMRKLSTTTNKQPVSDSSKLQLELQKALNSTLQLSLGENRQDLDLKLNTINDGKQYEIRPTILNYRNEQTPVFDDLRGRVAP